MVAVVMNVIAGDIGGTKTILAVYTTEGGPRAPLAEKSYPSRHYETFEAIVREFLDDTRLHAERACLGVAGPVVTGRARVTNLTWVVDASVLRSEFGWSDVILLNDMQSVGCAIPVLRDEDRFTLNEGISVPGGSIAVLAPGTGLGEGFLSFHDGAYRAFPSEGGHAAFAPVGPLQIGLLAHMNAQGYDHVSVERVCSGRLGIPNLYAYLKTTGLEEPDWLAAELAAADDPTPVILRAAQGEGRQAELAAAVLDLFVLILGAEAGNLALKVLATGGVYLAGGISPRILGELQRPGFLEALRAKGRFREVLTVMPVHVILDPGAGLLGAAACGLAEAQRGRRGPV